MKSSDKPSTTKKVTTKTTKKVVEPKVKETKTSKTTKKVAKKVDDTEVKKTTKKEVIKEEKKVTTKAKVAEADKVSKNKRIISKEVLEKATQEPTKVDTPKKTTRKPRAKKEEVKAEVPEIKEEPVVLGPITEEPVVAVPEHVTITTENKTTVVNAVTPEKTVSDLINALSHSAGTVDSALKDVANTTALMYDGYRVSINGKIIASFRKCIAHTDSRDFFNDITFALHNRFQDYPQEFFNKIIDILDTSPSRFNVIIG